MLVHMSPTQGQRAKSGPTLHFIWPARACRGQDFSASVQLILTSKSGIIELVYVRKVIVYKTLAKDFTTKANFFVKFCCDVYKINQSGKKL